MFNFNSQWRPLKSWPQNCPWSDPSTLYFDEWDEMSLEGREEKSCPEIKDLIEIHEYFEEENEKHHDENWIPEIGEEYWQDDCFDAESWQQDFNDCMNRLHFFCDAADEVQRTIDYHFSNEYLMMQAFTRRAFAIEYGMPGNSEELEYIGDKALDMVITRMIIDQFASIDADKNYVCPFQSKYSEGDMTKIRVNLVSKDNLSRCAAETGLDKYIMYGTEDQETDNSREDMVEALIGAVAIDSGWDYDVLEKVVDAILEVQFETFDKYIKVSMFEELNAWHQSRFGCIPDYELHKSNEGYECTLRFSILPNDKDIPTAQRVEAIADTRSNAREKAAEKAVIFIKINGLWLNIIEAGVVPSLNDCVNQLQELYQKKYIRKPEYKFEDDGELWTCACSCEAVRSELKGKTKNEAKKKAAFVTLVRILMEGDACKKSWASKAAGVYEPDFSLEKEIKKEARIRKRTCNGCKALAIQDQVEYEEGTCPLGYKCDMENGIPLENCSKPKYWNALKEELKFLNK